MSQQSLFYLAGTSFTIKIQDSAVNCMSQENALSTVLIASLNQIFRAYTKSALE